MRMLQALLGVGGGLLVGALACVVHPGPVDLPWVGLLIAALLVASGGWFLLEWEKPAAWLGYVLGVIGVTFWILMAPPDNDVVRSVQGAVSQAWLILAPLCALAPAVLVLRRKRK